MNTRDDDALGLVMLGGGVAAAGALAWRARRRASAPAVDTARGAAWIHPVPALGERMAVVSNPFRARASSDGNAREHLGADLMYRRRDARDLIAVFPAGTPAGSPLFFMPEGVPALAASTGVVTFAGSTPVGNTVIIRHPNRWATYYTHLATLAVERDAVVAAGQPIGTIGASPEDAAHLRHLHFELWKDATRSGTIDPAPYLAAWPRISVAWSPTSARVASAPTLRNGSLSPYRPIGARGEPYPAWVRNLRGESGVYVIREIEGPIVYVGSSIRRLYETLTRHFQMWRRYKGYWREHQFAEGADPGLTYARHSVEVAIKLTTPDDAHEEEMRMIRRLQPRDNQLGQPEPEPELEEAPF